MDDKPTKPILRCPRCEFETKSNRKYLQHKYQIHKGIGF